MTPPLEVFWKFLGNRAPEAHQIFFQLLKFGSASFGTIHQWPLEAQLLYTKPKFQHAPILIKIGTLVNF